MVNSNDYAKELFNGDTGVAMTGGAESQVVFKDHRGGIRRFRISDLPDHDPAFAITVHKSQGSEFDTVLLVIPDRASRVMTRQLLYTGVTRAKKRVIIAGSIPVIRAALDLDTQRNSGIETALTQGWGHR